MNIDRYFDKRDIDRTNIVWIARNKITTKTHVHMISGREIVFHRLPITYLREQLDEDEFYFIGNSIIVRADYIDRIEGSRYYMVDGSILTGTQRMQSVHNYRKHSLSDKRIVNEMTWGLGYIDIKKLPFEIMTILVKRDALYQKDRYTIQHCTDMLAQSLGIEPRTQTGLPFSEVFPQAAPAWGQAFEAAACEEQTTRMLYHDKKYDREMYAVCYPLKEQVCLCIMLPLAQILGAKLTEL